jgi:hypothetical protein
MLMVKTELRESLGKGIGLFAGQKIFRGTVVWKEDSGLTEKVYSEEEWRKLEKDLSGESFSQIEKYVYKYNRDGKYYLCIDDTRFINHSETPNIEEDEDGNDIAIKDIKEGEEIFTDYGKFYDKTFFLNLRKKWNF